MFLLKVHVGKIRRPNIFGKKLRGDFGMEKMAIPCHVEKLTLTNVKEGIVGLGGPILKLVIHKKRLRNSNLYSPSAELLLTFLSL